MTENLPALNAALNATAAVLLSLGIQAVKSGRLERHARCMLAASLVSAAFLASYLYYHFAVAKGTPTRYHGVGWKRGVYLALLLSHTVLATVNFPMILRTLYLATRGRIDRHRRLARWTFPIWLYVSVTGVAVYVVLYHFNPSPTASGG